MFYLGLYVFPAIFMHFWRKKKFEERKKKEKKILRGDTIRQAVYNK